jgi:hypothetical protein
VDKTRARRPLFFGLVCGALWLATAPAVTLAAEPFGWEQHKQITSSSACQKLQLRYDAKNNICLKQEGARPPKQAASSSGQTPQERCHNACSQGASNLGGSLWYSGIDENGVCVCGICDIPIPGISRIRKVTFCNVFSLGHP